MNAIVPVVIGSVALSFVPLHPAGAQPAGGATPTTNQMTIYVGGDPGTISREIYGHFSEHLGRCIYEGIWVEPDSSIPNTRGIRNDVVDALKKIHVPALRWPGGCFADEYHWKDGVGPREKRPAIINTHWGGVVENNHFGTHEFLDFCEQIGTQPYICGNVGSGTVQEMMEWVEYMTSDAKSPMADWRRANGREEPWRIPYFAVGNESWGCGGNMTAEFYADNFSRYNTFIKNYGGKPIYRVASGGLENDTHWTDVLMRQNASRLGHGGTPLNGYSLHYYTLPTGDWSHKGAATGFPESEWHETLRRCLRMDELIEKHAAVMDRYDPDKKVGLVVDEWGTWYDVEPGTNPGFLYQQNSLRDALVAGVTLNILNNHCDRVKMANIAQMVNVLQAMILTDKEKMIVTPSYWVFEMYAVHQDAALVPINLVSDNYTVDGSRIPAVNASVSRDANFTLHVSLCNLDPRRPAEVNCIIEGADARALSGRVLTAPQMDAHNTFERPEAVKPAPFEAMKITNEGFAVTLPPMSVVMVNVD